MPLSTRYSADVICPFYISDGKRTVICEGCMMSAREIHEFSTVEEKERWMKDVCCDPRYAKLCGYADLLDYFAGDE